MANLRGHFKVRCNSCKEEYFTFIYGEPECSECDSTDMKIFEVNELTAEEIVNLIGNKMEDSNHHSMSDLPSNVFYSISKVIKDQDTLNAIFQELYKDGAFTI